MSSARPGAVNGQWHTNSNFDKAKPEEFSPPLAGCMLATAHAERILEASKGLAASARSPAGAKAVRRR